MKKRIAGILLLVILGAVACREVESAQDITTITTSTSIPAISEDSIIPATEDVFALDDIKPGATLRPTKDPLVTLTATPTPPSFSNVRLTHDLVWLDRSGIIKGHLMRWDATKNIIEILAGVNEESLITLPGKVTDFDLRAKTVLVSLQVVNDAGEYFELGSIDLDTEEYLPLLNTANSLSAFSKINEVKLSPNGRWAAYVLSASSVGSASTSDLNHKLNVLRISDTSVPVLFASCEKGGAETTCIQAVRWSPDNAMLAWRAPGGMWIGKLDEGSKLVQPDHYGNDETDDLRYFPVSWSPQGKFILVRVGGWEGSYTAVYDNIHGRIIRIPATGTYAGHPNSSLSWLPSGQILVAISGHDSLDEAIPLKVFTYSIDTDLEDEWLYLSNSYELEAEIGDRLFQDRQNDSQVVEFLRARIFMDGSILNSTMLQAISLDLGSGQVTELNQTRVDFPEGFQNIYGRLVGSQQNASYVFTINYAVVYLSSDGLYATAIQDLFGSGACCFAWVDN